MKYLPILLVVMLAACAGSVEPLDNPEPTYAPVTLDTYQTVLRELSETIEADPPPTFAGLWIDHEGDVGVGIAFSEDAEETALSYEAARRLHAYGFLEIHEVTYSRQELEAQLEAFTTLLNDMDQQGGFIAAYGIDIVNNRIDVDALAPDAFLEAVAAAGYELPPAVTLRDAAPDSVQPLGGVTPVTMTDGSVIHLARQPVETSRTDELSPVPLQTEGRIVAEGGCLRFNGATVIWENAITLNADGTLGGFGGAVQLGETLYIAGRQVETVDLSDMPCEGPYLVVDGPVSMTPALRGYRQGPQHVMSWPFRPSDPFVHTWYQHASVPDGEPVEHTGRLTIRESTFWACMTLQTAAGDYTVVWPYDSAVIQTEEGLTVVTAAGDVLARVEGDATLNGTVQDVSGLDDCPNPALVVAGEAPARPPITTTDQGGYSTLHWDDFTQDWQDLQAVDVVGQLLSEGPCLRFAAADGTNYALLWPPYAYIETNDGAVVVKVESETMAQLGAETTITGRLIPEGGEREAAISAASPCEGPYLWVAFPEF